MDFSVVEVETLPDIAGARQVYGLASDVSDKNVAKVIFHHLQQTGNQGRFLPPGLAMISAVSVVAFRDQCLSLSSWSRQQDDEASLLKAFSRHRAKLSGEMVVWGSGRNLTQLFAVRSMVVGCAMPPLSLLPLASLLGGSGGDEDGRTVIAGRLGITSESAGSDEGNWEHYRKTGFSPLADKCLLNAVATSRLWLSYCQATGRITADDKCFLVDQIDRLPKKGDGAIPQ